MKFITITILFLITGTADAQWSNNPAINNPVCVQPGDQVNLSIVPDGSNGAITVWQDLRNNTDYKIYAQHVDVNGNMLWATNGIPVCFAGFNQFRPKAISDGAGGVIVVFEDNRIGGNDLYAQRIDGNGNILWAIDGMPVCTAGGFKFNADMISDGSGGAMIAWHDTRTATKVYVQHIDNNGAPLWTLNGVAVATNTRQQEYAKLTSNGNGGVIVTWKDRGSPGIQNAVTAQMIDANGTRQWASTGNTVCTNTANPSLLPEIVSNGNGGAIITWDDYRNIHYKVYAQNMSSSGLNLWAMDGIQVCPGSQGQILPKIVSDGNNGAIISWNDQRSGNAQFYAQKLNSAGALQWAADGVLITSMQNNPSFNPVITSDNAGGAVLAWTDIRNIDGDAYIQHIDANGAAVWAPDGTLLSSATGYQGNIAIAYEPNGTVIASWASFNTDADVYTSRVLNNGTLPIGLLSFSGTKQNSFNLLSWKTMHETGNRSYHIEKSKDGVRYTAIGTVNSLAGTQVENFYQYRDYLNNSTTSYYRLKIIEVDGNVHYSSIIRISNAITNIQAYPNPANNLMTIEWQPRANVPQDIQLIDMKGQIVRQWKMTNTSAFQVDCSGIDNGLYIIQLSDGDQKSFTRILITH